MRFYTLTAALVAVAASINGATADGADFTTTLTRTVERVVQTVTATRDSASSAPSSWVITAPLPTGTSGGSPYGNGTSVIGINAGPSRSQTSSIVTASSRPTGAATALRVEAAGIAAIAGVVGLFAL